MQNEEFLCCGPSSQPPHVKNHPSERLKGIIGNATSGDTSRIPWVEKYEIKRRSQLVMDKEPLTKFLGWLKQWGRDIQDDGGTSRKSAGKKKRKRRDSTDSDFIDDEVKGDEELKNKSVILAGPSGSGKSAMVYTLAKHCGFTVVEVNFSGPRSGQNVLRRVEEATLSRRLGRTGVVDKKHCLLLFKDIDQLYPEQDEGFYVAIARLLTLSCRPIVMTVTATHADCVIDPKIEKKEPLWIPIGFPAVSVVVSKVLLPIIEQEIEQVDKEYELDDHINDKEFIIRILDSIVRHCNYDIKKSINQTQLLWSSLFTLNAVHQSLSPHLDVDFVTPVKTPIIPDQATKNKKPTQEEMDEIVRNLGFLTDLDQLAFSSLPDPDKNAVPVNLRSFFDFNFNTIIQKRKVEIDPNPYNMNCLLRSMAFETDSDKIEWEKDGRLYDELVDSYIECGYYESYDIVGYIRTIVKTCVLNSIGTSAKRNRRVLQYFQMSKTTRDSICENFDFPQVLEIAKQAE